MSESKCPFCLAEIESAASKCRHCGEWLPAPAKSPPAKAPAAAAQVVVKDSPAFAIVTLVLWIFAAPLGLLLNVIGLFTGPRRGCFFAMLCVFVILPTIVTTATLVLNPEFAAEIGRWIDDRIEWLRLR